MISVTVARPDAALEAHWEELRPFAHNAFMDPAALNAAGNAMFAIIYVLLAWEVGAEPAKLVGMWALQAKQLLLWPFLEGLPFNYAFLSTPVLHPDYAEDTMPAFLAAIAANKSLPPTLVLRDLDAQGREYSAILEAAKKLPQLELRTDMRPVATREVGLKRSGSTRRKLKQDWNRLAATGELKLANVREAGEIGGAFEAFLELEARSWKGAGGTALLSNARDAGFARTLIGDMAARGNASVALLTLDGKPIAAQVLLYCGKTAYTWKTSYDPDLGKFSPGTLLVDRISMELLDSGKAEAIDSCARGDGFMAQLFTARKPMVDLVISARAARTQAFIAVSGYLRMREKLKQMRAGQGRRTGEAASPARPGVPAPASLEVSVPDPKADRAA
jgi:hypothetical protein